MYKLTNLREFNETKLLQPTDKRKRFLCYDYNTKLKKLSKNNNRGNRDLYSPCIKLSY